MRFNRAKAGLGIAALATLLAFGTTASAAPISKCDGAKKKCIGKYIAAQMGCHAKAEGKNLPVDSACLAKGVAKITGAGKGCFDKNEAKVPNDCSNTGMAAGELAAADAFIADIVTDVDPGYPAPVLSKCGAARKKCVGKKAAGLTGCSAKESKDGVGDPACAPKIQDKFDDGAGKGCDVGALAKGTDCLGAATSASLEAKVDAWSTGVDTRIENNPCPLRVTFSGDASAPESILDTGWTGISHRAPIITNGDVTVGLTCPGGGLTRPCGTCTVNGPVDNPLKGNGQLDTRRCTNDTAIRCTSNTPCTGGGGTCQYFFGSNLALAAGGVSTCVVNQFNGAVTGTANVESGEAATIANLTATVYNGPAVDAPCPRCIGDTTINDGAQDGTCDSGPNMGDDCDSNGAVFERPDFGQTSLDCPPQPAAFLAALPIDLTNATDPVVRTVTNASPMCGDGSGERCLCDTCNNATAQPCDNNADCPPNAGPGICGGKRCVGGTNDGGPCVGLNVSQCPGLGQCSRLGEPTKPSSCLDNTATVNIFDCTEIGSSGEGVCDAGPVQKDCSVASGHAQRQCSTPADCGGGGGSCVTTNRKCFLTGTNTGTGKVGTQTLIAVGMEDTPVQDESDPTLAAIFCVGPTNSSSINGVAGLPGPGRITIKGHAKGINP